MTHFVYILWSEKHKKFYTGMTASTDRRLAEHNAAVVRSTKAYVPWKLIYSEKHESRSAAREREKFFKEWSGQRIS